MRAARVGGVVVLAAAALGLAACGPAAMASPEVRVVRVSAPMRAPEWSDRAGVLLGLAGSRVEKVDPSRDYRSSLSASLPDIGADLATGLPSQSYVYVPQPGLNRVAVLSVASLRQVSTVPDGRAPYYLATGVGASVLLALSRDGRSVTGTDLREHKVVAHQPVHAAPGTHIDGPARERLVEFHLTGPRGIVHYQDGEREGSMSIPVADAAGDKTKVTRLYVAEQGTDRLLAVDTSKSQDNTLEVVGHADLGAPVRFVGVDDYQVYALAGDTLVVLSANSFEGFAGGKIPIVKRIPLSADLPAALHSGTPSGMAVGADRVWVTFAGQPYVVGIAKPAI